MPSLPNLPPELWIDIHRLVVSDILQPAQVSANVDVTNYNATGPEEALNELDLQSFLEAARSLTNVCRLWNNLAQGLLYENICVPDQERWLSLRNALQKPDNACRVRRVRLSSDPVCSDHNIWVLQQCGPHIETLVHPDQSRKFQPGHVDTQDISLPAMLSLKHLYWVKNASLGKLLRTVLTAAPNLEHISLASMARFEGLRGGAAALAVFPPIPCVQSLRIIHLRLQYVRVLLSTELPRLTHLTISPATITPDTVPVLPSLRVLTLVPVAGLEHVSFSAILDHFPALYELRYHATNPPEPVYPDLPAATLACVRLYFPGRSSDLRESVWLWLVEAALKNAELLLHPMLPVLQRVVLDGAGWGGCVDGAEWAGLRARGCCVEEGILLTLSPHITPLVEELCIVLVGSETSFECDEDGGYLQTRNVPWVMDDRIQTLSLVLPLLDLKRISLTENSPVDWNQDGEFSMNWTQLGGQLKAALMDVFSSPKLEAVHLRGITIESPRELLSLFSDTTSLKEMALFRIFYTARWDKHGLWPKSQMWRQQLQSLLLSDLQSHNFSQFTVNPQIDLTRVSSLTLKTEAWYRETLLQATRAGSGSGSVEHLRLWYSRSNLSEGVLSANLRSVHFYSPYVLSLLRPCLEACPHDSRLEYIGFKGGTSNHLPDADLNATIESTVARLCSLTMVGLEVKETYMFRKVVFCEWAARLRDALPSLEQRSLSRVTELPWHDDGADDGWE
ncbi:hypothetical protein DFH06DRAFT_1321549 [Mycena polygramma]|nr:hypothetical protein DFH06DRAFT_1321549 [Mycena polygramma]